MRILAIRGKNLASLAGTFEVDFEVEPIRSAGIFAIIGPTGAGKTTILDAICLALFDSVPRMDTAERGASVGRIDTDGAHQIRYGDVRGILRHGCTSGYSEVDFVGQDGRRYRSRWEVNRARSKTEGKLQPQRVTLTDLGTGQIVGDKKTDTLQQIEKRVGLSASQFRRAVLLAQGDFDTFIKADSKDRADLLERITGTEVYSRISQAVFARAKVEREANHALTMQLQEHRSLSIEQRAEVESNAKDAKTHADRLEAEKAAAIKAREWYATKARLDERVEEGVVVLSRAQDADRAADEDRASLGAARRAFRLRAELEAAAPAESALAAANISLAESAKAERTAIEVRDAAVSASNAAKADRDVKRAAYEAIGQELDKAQRLDAVIETARAELASQKEALNERLVAKRRAQDAISEIAAALEATRKQSDNDNLWLEQHQAVEALAVRSDDVAKDLSERLALSRERDAIAERVGVLEREAAAAEAARKEREAASTALQVQARALGEKIAVAGSLAASLDRPSVEVKRDAITQAQVALADAGEAANIARAANSRIASEDAEKERLDALIHELGNAIARTGAALPDETARLEEARRSLDLSEAAGSEAAEHLRLKLEEGQPCPVCGSTDHPVTEVGRLLKARIDADRTRVAELAEMVSASQRALTRAEAQLAASREALKGVDERKASLVSELREGQERWLARIETIVNFCGQAGVSVPAFPEDATLESGAKAIGVHRRTLESALGEARKTIARATEAEVAVSRYSLERESVRADQEALDAETGRLKEEEDVRRNEVNQLGAALKGLERASTGITARLDTILKPVFPDWEHRVAELGDGAIGAIRNLIDEWKKRRRAVESARVKIAGLDAELEGARATHKASEATAASAEALVASRQGELDGLLAERGDVIGGRPVAEVRAEYRTRAEDAEKVFSAAEPARSKMELAAAAKSAAVAAAHQTLETAKLNLDVCERALREKLEDGGLVREQATAAILRGESWLDAEQTRLDSLRGALTAAASTLAERKAAVERHIGEGLPDISKDAVEAAVTELEVRWDEALRRHIETSSLLKQDDHARARIAEIQALLDARQEAVRVWGQLDTLIGSADGTKFQRFAQSLTLTHLLHLANRHLSELQPRYELQRTPGTELVLQVIDRDMADEVRGVHSLSGGERFLVSLALALGLASMSSAQGVKVESLFIDEGFGGLDSSSLSMAIAVLEQLHATGRRVGVISHVEELKERIAVKIAVTPVGAGRSTVEVVAG